MVKTVEENLKEFKIDLNYNEIKEIKREKFKDLVKGKCKAVALNFLQNEKKKTESKMGRLKYKKLEMAKYLKSKKLTLNEKKLLFKLRCRMFNVGNNFGQKNNCKLCNEKLDCQEHLLECSQIKKRIKEIKTK